MKAWFDACATVEEAKTLYRDLMKRYHPDLGGDAEVCKEVNAALDAWLADGMGRAFREQERATGRGFAEDTPYVFADILARIVKMDGIGRIEVIGHWIYAFDSFVAKDALRALGFWFSGTHKAWVFSGGSKRGMRATCTTAQLHAKWEWIAIEKGASTPFIGVTT
jgi:hypothetical protein